MTNEELAAEIRRLVKEEDVLKAKYRWHDMRENPKDLPKKVDHYICCYDDENGTRIYTTDMYVAFENKFMMDGTWKLIAWRRIEKLKEDEE